MQNNTKKFGFNILTEKIKNIEFDNESFESGKAIKQKSQPFTDEALILQSILEYSIGFGTDNYFKSRELSKNHLLDNCEYYKILYLGDKTPRGPRIESMNPRVVTALNKLECLELVDSKPSEAKNGEPTEEFRFTKLGRLLGLLLFFKKGKNKVSEDLYNHLLDFYDDMEQSSAKFWSIFLKKCYKSEVFDKVIFSFIDLLESASDDKELFIKQIKNFNPVFDKESANLIFESFEDLKDQSPLKHEILLYNFKLKLEEIHERKSGYFESFEKLRFSSRQEPYYATLEGRCKDCNKFTSVTVPIIPYFESYVTSNSENSLLKIVKCFNSECKQGILNFEFEEKTKLIQKSSNVVHKREKEFKVLVFESAIDVGGTIFERTNKGDYTIKSKRIQAILVFLLDNPDKFYKTRELQNSIINERCELFNNSSSNMSSDLAEDYYKQFNNYLNTLKFCDLVEFIKVPSDKDESMMVEAYKLSKPARVVALLSKFQSSDEDEKSRAITEIHQELNSYIEVRSYSLSLFCSSYFQACIEGNLFTHFIEFLNKYLLFNKRIVNQIDLLTQMIFLRFENDESKNEELWSLWKSSMMNLNEQNGELFFNHIRTHINRLVEKKVHDLARYEIVRYENRAEYKMAIIEAACQKCLEEYVYLAIPLSLYLPFLFINSHDLAIFHYLDINPCQKCNNRDFNFIRI